MLNQSTKRFPFTATTMRWLGLCVAMTIIAVASQAADAAPPTPKLLSQSVVFKYPLTDPYDRQNKFGFNHAPSVVVLPDGRLLAAWFSGPHEGSVHQVILGTYSSDGGQTWSEATVLNDEPRRSDFDPAFIVDGKRTWMFFTAGRWDRYPFVGLRDVERKEVGIASYKIYERHSDDSGLSWSEPKRVLDDVGWGCRSNGIRLKSGEMVLPLHHFGMPTAAVLRSVDGGKSWKQSGLVELPKKIGADEPSVTQLPSGDLMMIFRSRDGKVRASKSTDQGQTWSDAQEMGLVAAAASHNIMTTTSGYVVLTHNACKPPLRTPLTMRVSDDEGTSWGQPLVLAKVTPPEKGGEVFSRIVCYPSVAELPDNVLIAVWTEIEMSATSQWGVIHAARVLVK